MQCLLCSHVAGISFLPYPGAAYAAQVLDGSAVPTQTLLPGVAYNAVTTTAIQAQTQYSQPVTSSYRVVEQNTTVANVVPILNSVNSGQTTPLKQPLQSINLTDLLDYSFLMEHGMGEAAGTMDLRNPAVLANMLQSLNAASMPSSDDRSTQSSQSVDIRQFPAAKQPAHTQQQLLRETVNVPQQHVPLSNQQLPVSQLYAGYGASTVASTAAVLQSSQQKDTMPGTGLVWPWADQLLLADKSQNETALGLNPLSVPTPVTSSSLPVSYEAVSPASAVTDNMSYSLLDNLQLAGDAAGNYQLSSFLGPTVDSSTLFTAVPYSLALSSQQSRPDVWSAAAVTQPSYSASSGSRLQTGLGVNDQSSVMGMTPIEPAVSRQSTVELDKLQKQKSNLGVVMPMIHSSLSERNSVISEASSVSCRTTSASAAAEPQSQYLANSQLSTDKSAGQGTDSAAGGIVLTNITGNVYVNQYTMMPGGTQPLDNALLHADLAAGSGTYDSMVDETAYSYAAPSVAVVLNSTDDDLSSFAAEPLTADSSVVEQPRQPKSSSRKSAPPESSFFGADAAPILAAKPSNKFESSFLQFVCGHKAETLSSVLNSPIKTRPALPKYIPEPPRRPKPVEVSVAIDSEDKTEELGEPSGSVLAEDRTTPSTSESTISVSNVRCLALFLIMCYFLFCYFLWYGN